MQRSHNCFFARCWSFWSYLLHSPFRIACVWPFLTQWRSSLSEPTISRFFSCHREASPLRYLGIRHLGTRRWFLLLCWSQSFRFLAVSSLVTIWSSFCDEQLQNNTFSQIRWKWINVKLNVLVSKTADPSSLGVFVFTVGFCFFLTSLLFYSSSVPSRLVDFAAWLAPLVILFTSSTRIGDPFASSHQLSASIMISSWGSSSTSSSILMSDIFSLTCYSLSSLLSPLSLWNIWSLGFLLLYFALWRSLC